MTLIRKMNIKENIEQITKGYCKDCDKTCPVVLRKPEHMMHLILTILSLWCWLPVWIYICAIDKYKCNKCGSKKVKVNKDKRIKIDFFKRYKFMIVSFFCMFIFFLYFTNR